MRFFNVDHFEGKLRIIQEAVGQLAAEGTFTHPSDYLPGNDVRSEEELLATSAGRRALRAWREAMTNSTNESSVSNTNRPSRPTERSKKPSTA